MEEQFVRLRLSCQNVVIPVPSTIVRGPFPMPVALDTWPDPVLPVAFGTPRAVSTKETWNYQLPSGEPFQSHMDLRPNATIVDTGFLMDWNADC